MVCVLLILSFSFTPYASLFSLPQRLAVWSNKNWFLRYSLISHSNKETDCVCIESWYNEKRTKPNSSLSLHKWSSLAYFRYLSFPNTLHVSIGSSSLILPRLCDLCPPHSIASSQWLSSPYEPSSSHLLDYPFRLRPHLCSPGSPRLVNIIRITRLSFLTSILSSSPIWRQCTSDRFRNQFVNCSYKGR